MFVQSKNNIISFSVSQRSKRQFIYLQISITNFKDITIDNNLLVFQGYKFKINQDIRIFKDYLSLYFGKIDFLNNSVVFKEICSNIDIEFYFSQDFFRINCQDKQYFIYNKNIAIKQNKSNKTVFITQDGVHLLNLFYNNDNDLRQFDVSIISQVKQNQIQQSMNYNIFNVVLTHFYQYDQIDNVIIYQPLDNITKSKIHFQQQEIVVQTDTIYQSITLSSIELLTLQYDSKLIVIKLSNSMQLFMSFDSLPFMEQFVVQLLNLQSNQNSQAKVHYVNLLNHNIISNSLQLDVETLINSIQDFNNKEQVFQKICYIYQNYQRNLPCISKNTQLLEFISKQITLEPVTNVQFIYFQVLLFLISSRAQYEYLCGQNATIFQNLSTYLINKNQKYHDLMICLLIRYSFSYQWQPTILEVGARYDGLNLLYCLQYQPFKYYNLISVSKKVQGKSSALAKIGIHSRYQQGQKYIISRTKIEQFNRLFIVNQTSDLIPKLGKFIVNLQTQSFLITSLVLGILQDILVTKTHLEKQQNDSLLKLQLLRKQLFELIFENSSYFIQLTCSNIIEFQISSTLIMKQFFQEQLLSTSIKNLVSEQFLLTGNLIQLVETILKNEYDILSQIQWSLLSIMYVQNKNVQNIVNKILPISLTKGMQAVNIKEIYSQQSKKLQLNGKVNDIRQLLYTPSYSSTLVWDFQIALGVQHQLVAFLLQFKQQQTSNTNLCLNYEQLNISYRSLSNRELSQYDIDIHGFVLSQLIVFEPNIEFNFIGQNQTEYYLIQQIDRPFKQLKFLIQNVNPQKVADIYYSSFIQEINDFEIKQVLIYVLNTIYLQFNVQFNYFNEFTSDIIEQIQKQKYGLVLYQLYFLETLCYQQQQNDVLKRNNFFGLVNNKLISSLYINILSSTQLLKQDNALLIPNSKLIYNSTYHNLYEVSYRLIYYTLFYLNQHLEQYSSFPFPIIITLCKSQCLLISLYNTVIELFIGHSNSPMFIQICQLMNLIVTIFPSQIQQIIDIGFIQLFLSNQFGVIENVHIFCLIKKLISISSGLQILQSYLPISFVYYIQNNTEQLVADIFCTPFCLQLNCFFSNNLRQQLQKHLKTQLQQISIHYLSENVIDNDTIYKLELKFKDCAKTTIKFDNIKVLNFKSMIYIELIDKQKYIYYFSMLSPDNYENDQVSIFHEQMIQKFQTDINISKVKVYFEQLLCFEEEKHRLDLLSLDFFQIGMPYYHQTIKLLIIVFLTKIQLELDFINQNSREYEDTQKILSTYIKQTGGTGKLLLQTKQIGQLPDYYLKIITNKSYELLQIINIILQVHAQFLDQFQNLEMTNFKAFENLSHSIDLLIYLQQINFTEIIQILNKFNSLMDNEILQVNKALCEQKKAQYYETIFQLEINIMKRATCYTELDDIIIHCHQIILNEIMKQNLIILENLNYNLLIQILETSLNLLYFNKINELSGLYLEQLFTFIKYLSVSKELSLPLQQSKIFIFLILYAYKQNSLAPFILGNLMKYQQNNEVIQQFSYLGYLLSHNVVPESFNSELLRNVYTDRIVYTQQLQQGIIKYLEDLTQLQDYQYDNIQFSCQQYTTFHYFYKNYCFTSILTLIYNQFGSKFTNFYEQIYKISSNEQILVNLINFYKENYNFYQEFNQKVDTFDSQFQQVGNPLIRMQSVYLSIILRLVYQQTDFIPLLQTWFIEHLLILSVQNTYDHDQEILSEQASILLTLIDYEQNENYNLLIKYNSQLLMVLLEYTKIYNYSICFLLKDQYTQQINQSLEQSQFQLINLSTIPKTSYILTKKSFIQYLLQYTTKQEQIICYCDLIQLYLLIKSLNLSTDYNILITDDDYILKSAISQLQKIMSISTFLKQILPIPLQLAILNGDLQHIFKVFNTSVELPSFVWNSTCTQQLLLLLEDVISNKIIPNLFLTQNILQDQDFNYYNVIDYIVQFYTQSLTLYSNVFINIYNEQSLNKIVNLPQPNIFITDILEFITNETFINLGQETVINFITAFYNVIRQQPVFIYTLIENPNFDKFINLIFTKNQWLPTYSIDNIQTVLQYTSTILETMLNFSFDYSKIISKQTFVQLYKIILLNISELSIVDIDNSITQYKQDLLLQLISISSLLLQNPDYRLYFQRTLFGYLSNSKIYGPFTLYLILIQTTFSSSIRYFAASALETVLLSSVDTMQEITNILQNENFIELRQAFVELEISYLGDNLPVPRISLQAILQQQRIQKPNLDNFTQADSLNALNCFNEVGPIPCQNSVILSQFLSHQPAGMSLKQVLEDYQEIVILNQILQFSKEQIIQ